MSNKKYILGDCMTYLKEYKGNHFDLAIVDPPYGLKRFSKQGGGNSKITKAFGGNNKNWNNNKPTKEYFKQLFRVSKNQIIWGGNNFNLPNSEYFVIWHKTNKLKFSFSMVEQAWTNIRKPAKLFKYMEERQRKHKIHPTQKPVALYRWLLQNYAKPNDLILDTHVGSASSLIACEIEGFNYVGFEKDKDYFRDSTKRIKQHLSQITMF